MKLDKDNNTTVVETKEYRSFKEKIDITKKYAGRRKIFILDNYIAIERKELAN